ncbi:ribonuclease HI [Arcobacter venerupis]|uniref:ribonuclease H n=1 Tax=Arcobacter venerupis TaxID=1054033 RepID=A0AAE7E4I0_9BACT|nr:ribonuclease H family protein [Arcobacter venerupis]QKF66716.1 ribonuclease HI [Arcobacter venerupis]RWS49555.1 ribonuclease HI [Arcobacter venerupis]
MKIDNSFIQLISHKDILNKEQFKILGLDYPPVENWKNQAFDKEVSKNDMNLLMLLKGDLALKAQEQIIKNYHMVLEFNNIKVKSVYELPKEQISEKKVEINEDDEYIRIYCDGACSGNPGNAGSGLAIYSNKKNPVLLYGAYEEEGTNNIAELNALHQALLIAKQTSSDNIISIFSDSKYAIDCITVWAYGWKKNGWSKKGGEIKNLELIKEAHQLYEKLKAKIEINHVKGHAGVEGNELADRMAVYTIKAKNKNFAFYSYNKIDEVLGMKSY